MATKIPTFETLVKANRYRKSFKPSLDCKAYSPAWHLAAAVFWLLSLGAQTQQATSR